jgi:hypothetical protein
MRRTAITAEQADEQYHNLTSRVQQLREATVDALTDTRALRMETIDADLPGNQRVRMMAHAHAGAEVPIALLPGAHNQVAAKVGIPVKYYDRMLTEAPELLATNVNEWFAREPEARLLRMVRRIGDPGEDATYGPVGADLAMRAFLSDRYRPLDHGALLDTVLPVALEAGAKVAEWNLDHKRLHVRFVGVQRDVYEVAQQLREREPEKAARHFMDFHEMVSQGLALRNSETGHAALSVSPLIEVMRCVNMLVVTEVKRVAHLGRRQEADEDWLNADTKRLDDAATFLKVRDKVIEIFSPETMERATVKLLEANGTPLPIPTAMPVMEFVGNIGGAFKLNEAETDLLREEFVQERATTGNTNVFTLSQAVTATARRLKDDDHFERGVELETLGWRLLDEPVSKLLKAGKAE